MKQHRMRLVLLACLALAACSSQADKDNPPEAATVNIDAIDSVSDPAVAKAIPKRVPTPAPGTPSPDAAARNVAMAAKTGAEDNSAQGAADLVRHYYALIGQGQYAQARMLWAGAGSASGTTAEGFAAALGKYEYYRADVGLPGDIDAGAGQRYVTVPVVIDARLKTGGAPLKLVGELTLHRTEVVGATEEQQHWRIRSADIKPAS